MSEMRSKVAGSGQHSGASRESGADEWRCNWLLVFSAMVGLSFGTVPSSSLGLFMAPLQQEFGWSRSEISAGLTVFALISLPLTPLLGMVVDKFGSRRIAVPGLLLFGLCFAAFGLQSGSRVAWFSLWIALTLASLAIRTLVFNAAVSSAFHANRGMAIAIVLCGPAMAQIITPLLTRWLVDTVEWRMAFISLGVGWGGIAFVIAYGGFRLRAPANKATGGDAGSPVRVPGGLSVAQALRAPAFYRIAGASFLQCSMVVAASVHMVPMLMGKGIGKTDAASVAALLGIASLAGNLATGWLVDRVRGGWLPPVSFAAAGIGYLMLLTSTGSWLQLAVSVLIIGYCSSASLQLTTYLTTRYVGMRNFGSIFGLVSTLIALSAGIGPFVAGAIYDATGAYDLLLTGGCAVAVIVGLLMSGLGPYPQFMPEEPDSEAVRPQGVPREQAGGV